MINDCPDCASDTHFCDVHQKGLYQYEQLNRGDIDRDRDPVYLALLKKKNTENVKCQ